MNLQGHKYFILGYRTCLNCFLQFIGVNKRTLYSWEVKATSTSDLPKNVHQLDDAGGEFLAWFDLLVKEIGNYYSSPETISIPYTSSLIVWSKYIEEEGKISESEAYHLLDLYRSEVHTEKPSSLLRCTDCGSFAKLQMTGTPEEKAHSKRDKKVHIDLVFDEKAKERYHNEKARKYPNKYWSLNTDSMNSSKSFLPKFFRETHRTAGASRLHWNLTAIISSGTSPKIVLHPWIDLFPHDANLTIQVLTNYFNTTKSPLPS